MNAGPAVRPVSMRAKLAVLLLGVAIGSFGGFRLSEMSGRGGAASGVVAVLKGTAPLPRVERKAPASVPTAKPAPRRVVYRARPRPVVQSAPAPIAVTQPKATPGYNHYPLGAIGKPDR